MTLNHLWFSGHLQELPIDECLELLDQRPIGRISYCTQTGPVTVPVNHILDGQDVIFRTSPDSELGEHLLSEPRVCFQVDSIDEFTQSGSSVLVRGRAKVIHPMELPVGASPTPWVDGTRVLHVRVTGETITGRRVTGL
jgi:hypothetical protein